MTYNEFKGMDKKAWNLMTAIRGMADIPINTAVLLLAVLRTLLSIFWRLLV